jgi:hypothetical protein
MSEEVRREIEEAYRRGAITAGDRDRLLRILGTDPRAAKAFLDYLKVLRELRELARGT